MPFNKRLPHLHFSFEHPNPDTWLSPAERKALYEDPRVRTRLTHLVATPAVTRLLRAADRSPLVQARLSASVRLHHFRGRSVPLDTDDAPSASEESGEVLFEVAPTVGIGHEQTDATGSDTAVFVVLSGSVQLSTKVYDSTANTTSQIASVAGPATAFGPAAEPVKRLERHLTRTLIRAEAITNSDVLMINKTDHLALLKVIEEEHYRNLRACVAEAFSPELHDTKPDDALELDRIARYFTMVQTWKADEIIMKEGDTPSMMFLVSSGRCFTHLRVRLLSFVLRAGASGGDHTVFAHCNRCAPTCYRQLCANHSSSDGAGCRQSVKKEV